MIQYIQVPPRHTSLLFQHGTNLLLVMMPKGKRSPPPLNLSKHERNTQWETKEQFIKAVLVTDVHTPHNIPNAGEYIHKFVRTCRFH